MHKATLPVTDDSLTLPVYIGSRAGFTAGETTAAAAAITRMQALLPHTRLVFIPAGSEQDRCAPIWFSIVRDVAAGHHVIKPTLEVAFASLVGDAACPDFHDLLRHALAPVSAYGYTAALFHDFVTGRAHDAHDAAGGDAAIVCAQLAALEQFNRKLASEPADDGFFITRCNVTIEPTLAQPAPATPVVEAPGLDRVHAIGAAADHFAIHYQTRWQQLMLATTNQLASLYPRNPFGRLIGLCAMLLPASLILCGIVSALGYAMFTELAGGCQYPDFFLGEACMSPIWKRWVGPTAFFGFYLLSLAWAWCRYAAAKAERVENQHQDYRLLAECLRVQYVLGVLDQPNCVHDYLPMVEHAEAGWVRMAVLSLEHKRKLQQPAALISAVHSPLARESNRFKRACQDFVIDQAAYHADKLIVRRERAVAVLNWLSSLGLRTFLLILPVLAVQAVLELLHGPHFLSEMAHHLLIVLQIVSLAFWGSMRKVADLFGLEQEIQRGRLVMHALSDVSSETPGAEQRLMHALKVFAGDQAAWHALQRAKPIEAATGA